MYLDSPSLILDVKGHPLYFVRPGMLFKIGRQKGNDILLPDKTVSRTHACIKWDKKYPRIIDLQSTAGMKVDGLFVSYKHLHATHKIQLGNSIISATFSKSETNTPTQILNAPAIIDDISNANNVVLFHEYGNDDIEGYFDSTEEIHNFLIWLENNKRTGTLTVINSFSAELLFAAGRIKQVKCGNIHNLEALQHVCNFANGSYKFTVNVDIGETNLDTSITFFLRDLKIATTQRTPRKGN